MGANFDKLKEGDLRRLGRECGKSAARLVQEAIIEATEEKASEVTRTREVVRELGEVVE